MRRSRTQSARRRNAQPQQGKPPSLPPQLVRIEKPIYGGAFLAHMEGKAVFVPLTLPGEEAQVHITEEKRGYVKAEAEEIVTAAPERIAPACRHYGACGGCHYQHADYATQLGFKQTILRETLERGGVRAPDEIGVLAGDESQSWAYRNRIRLAFDAQGNPGYRGRHSHAVIPIAECPIAAPLLVKAALAFAEAARQNSAASHLTELSLFCDATETALLASVFTKSAEVGRFHDLARSFAAKIPTLKGIELVFEPRGGEAGGRQPNAVESPRTLAEWGDRSIAYCAAGFEYRVGHGAFFQVNRWLVDGLVEAVSEGQEGSLAWDLFAGAGLFARRLAANFKRVVAVESAHQAAGALKENLLGTTGSAVRASTLDFLGRNAKAGRSNLMVPDLIVVDPPRTGLGAEITTLLGTIGAPALTYVSCDPATLARDLRALVTGGYSIESAILADLFPQTFHLETVVRLRRSC